MREDACIFCKIASKQVLAEILYEDEQVVVFKDLAPQAPLHLLIIPKEHYQDILQVNTQSSLMTCVLKAIQTMAKTYGVDQSGFRLVVNTGADGGQSVSHLHFHLLGKRALQWPPG